MAALRLRAVVGLTGAGCGCGADEPRAGASDELGPAAAYSALQHQAGMRMIPTAIWRALKQNSRGLTMLT